MESVITDQEAQVSSLPIAAAANGGTLTAAPAADEIYRLGVWLAGLESFISTSGVAFADYRPVSGSDDYIDDLRLAKGALQRCIRLIFFLITSPAGMPAGSAATPEELQRLASACRGTLLLAESLERSGTLGMADWQEWCNVFNERFYGLPACTKLVSLTEKGGEEYFATILQNASLGASWPNRHEFGVLLPKFGRILRLLDVVGEMLANDEPLKPSLLIFAKVSELTQDLIRYLNQRVEHSTDKADEFINSLDVASYLTSLELKKVVQQELSGLSAVRPATIVYARIEASHALLTDSFHQLVVGFIRQIDPAIDAFALFPSFGVKLERSIALRKRIYDLVTLVKKAEQEPSDENIAGLNLALLAYLDDGLRFMFYRDTETFERFVEEILVMSQKKDLVPILHRFGAYLETLFGQVNMRTILENHPFEAQAG